MIQVTAEFKAVMKARINEHKKFDAKRFSTRALTLGYDDILEKLINQCGKCYWTGKPMTFKEGKCSEISIDRLDNDKPHSSDNTVLVQKAMNIGRGDATVEEWLYYLGYMGLR
jgi:hypothetical protein